jgi:multidrug efflux system membrane fusion protein
MSRSRTIRWVLLVAAITALGYLGWQKFHGDNHPAQADARKAAPARIAVPVRIAPVKKADFPVYLTGLGTVQGFNTVLVRTRVDGQINRIAFQEGQFVKEGDTLVEIDPRPFQAALDQAKAKKAQDEANLANANLDLQRFTKLGEFATRQQTDTQRSTVLQLTGTDRGRYGADRECANQLDYATVKAPISGVAGPAPGRRRQYRQRRDPNRAS